MQTAWLGTFQLPISVGKNRLSLEKKNRWRLFFPSWLEKTREFLFTPPLRCFLMIYSMIWIMMTAYFTVTEGRQTINCEKYRQKCTSTLRQIELLVQFHSLQWDYARRWNCPSALFKVQRVHLKHNKWLMPNLGTLKPSFLLSWGMIQSQRSVITFHFSLVLTYIYVPKVLFMGKSINAMLSDKCLQFAPLLLPCPNKNTSSRNWGYTYKRKTLHSFSVQKYV